jgi:hypothetical protein
MESVTVFPGQFTFRGDQVHRILEIAAMTPDACADDSGMSPM